MSSSPRLDASFNGAVRHLIVVLGDQLDHSAAVLSDLDPELDAILMMEVDAEAAGTGAGIRSHKQRTAFFLSAMRHFALEQMDAGIRVRYIKLDAPQNTHALGTELKRAVRVLSPKLIRMTHPGEWRVLDEIEDAAAEADTELEIVDDNHFFTTPCDFEKWAKGRKSLTMEYFYREQRRRLGYLMDGDDPEGGEWNYDKQNRETFKSRPKIPNLYQPQSDEVTEEVIQLVQSRYPDNPGSLDRFIWPVTRDQARRALKRFIETRLDDFGPYEDAMWAGEPFLYHAVLSAPLNLKLLNPRECVEAAIEAYRDGTARLNSVEGFVRQLIGWREFIRGVYWTQGRDYRDRNGLKQYGDLPEFYYTGDTDMRCMSECLKPVIDHAWSHHIPRLMVLSNFALISGVQPRAIGDWFFEMYADAVDWVTTPNTIGMGMHADHAVVGTKPYSGSGKYIDRMSNFCKDCAYDKNKRVPDDKGKPPCPFNTFYWDFLIRNRDRFRGNNRMAMILKNVDRMSDNDRTEITVHGRKLRKQFGIGAISS
ncbi:MAG: cryptochrome/photolyase family protein [Phycisphaerales bacterium]